jgi:hypothetical protein
MSLKQNDIKIKSFFLLMITQLFVATYLIIRIGELRYVKPEITIDQKSFKYSDMRPKKNDNSSESAPIVASKNGTKYYYLHCSGVGRIKEENRVYFDSFQEAESAGYEIAKNCQKR